MEFPSQAKSTLVEILETKLRELNWKQAVLAERSGVSPPVISRLLKGSKLIGVENITKILDTLGFINIGLKSGIPEKAWVDTKPKGYSTREIKRMEALEVANKKINEYLEKENKQLKQKVEKLENETRMLKKRWADGRREEDQEGLDVLALRKKEK